MSKRWGISLIASGVGGFMIGWSLSPDHMLLGILGVAIMSFADGIAILLSKE